MNALLLDRLAHFQPQGSSCDHSALTLRRAWPRSIDHVLLEFITSGGTRVVGQWKRDADELSHVANRTNERSEGAKARIENVGGTGILLQHDGADRRLVGLARTLTRSDARLIVHHPERRAVVCVGEEEKQFIRFVKPGRVHKNMQAVRWLASQTQRSFLMPDILAFDNTNGTTAWSELAGRSLFDSLSETLSESSLRMIGEAIKSLHDCIPHMDFSIHDGEAEALLLEKCLQTLEAFRPAVASAAHRHAEKVIGALRNHHTSPISLMHRDLYDKQIFISQDEHIGILDFDTLSKGPAELDLANVVVHLELRAIQGLCTESSALRAATLILSEYKRLGGLPEHLNIYADATRMRLVAVYAMRPMAKQVPYLLLQRIGTPCWGT